MKLYSRRCTYTIRALTAMAARAQAGRFRAADICRAAGIPESYTRKTFQTLVQAGFLEAATGPGGGYRMISDPTHTSLRQVVEAVDGTDEWSGCVLGHARCNPRHPCALHPMWQSLKARMLADLEHITVHDSGKAMGRARVGASSKDELNTERIKRKSRQVAQSSRKKIKTAAKKDGQR